MYFSDIKLNFTMVPKSIPQELKQLNNTSRMNEKEKLVRVC